MGCLINLLKQFHADERGVFAMIFAVMAIVLIALGGAVVDFVSVEQVRNRAQVALDAAALALQRDIYDMPQSQISSKAQDLVVDRINDDRVTAQVVAVTIDPEVGSLYLEARVEMPTMFVSLVGVPQLGARISSQATRGSTNIEVAVAVDITGSMNETIAVSSTGGRTQTKVAALRSALNQLIDIVVQDEQTPTYSKMAVVPYSMAVNVGNAYATTIRGAIKAPTAITGTAWSSGTAKTITGATKANPVVITSSGHGFTTGDRVYINGVGGMTQINNKIFTVTTLDANRYQLTSTNGTNFGAYSNSSGTAIECLISTCEVTVTSAGHGLANNDNVYIYGLKDTNNATNDAKQKLLNNNANGDTQGSFLVWPVGSITANSFVLVGSSRTVADYGTYGSGGTAACVQAGCQYQYYVNKNGGYRRQQISTCVTERTTNPFNDASPATTLLGRNYPSSSNPCLTSTILPLTDDKTALHAVANGLVAGGSTAGHTGVAWSWYLVSPNFSGPWPSDSQPAPASKPNVLKAVVLMTDGEFNSVYCRGVISQSSTTGSGDTNNQINCNAPNGSAYSQAEELCEQMKAEGSNIRVYTVGFDVVDSQSARNLMRNCASEPSMAYEATTGAGLAAVFADIGENLAYLRLTQ